jgi:hypothetical protein
MDWQVVMMKFCRENIIDKASFPWSNTLFLLCSISDLCMCLDDQLCRCMVMLGPTLQQRWRHQHVHETFSTNHEILVLELRPTSSLGIQRIVHNLGSI